MLIHFIVLLFFLFLRYIQQQKELFVSAVNIFTTIQREVYAQTKTSTAVN